MRPALIHGRILPACAYPAWKSRTVDHAALCMHACMHACTFPACKSRTVDHAAPRMHACAFRACKSRTLVCAAPWMHERTLHARALKRWTMQYPACKSLKTMDHAAPCTHERPEEQRSGRVHACTHACAKSPVGMHAYSLCMHACLHATSLTYMRECAPRS
eukprot:364389-Chlamydomonas_euryale.AAC.12